MNKQQEADIATIKRLLAKSKKGVLDADEKMIIRIIAKRAPLHVRPAAIAIWNEIATAEGLQLIVEGN